MAEKRNLFSAESTDIYQRYFHELGMACLRYHHYQIRFGESLFSRQLPNSRSIDYLLKGSHCPTCYRNRSRGLLLKSVVQEIIMVYRVVGGVGDLKAILISRNHVITDGVIMGVFESNAEMVVSNVISVY